MISADVSKTIASISAKVGRQEKAVNRALKVNAMEFSEYVKDSINRTQSTGREYRRRTVTHRASSAGFPPNTDTGFLAFSTSPSRRVRNFTTEVIVGARYARSLEFGTRNMKPRPFVRPARQKLALKMANRIRSAMNVT